MQIIVLLFIQISLVMAGGKQDYDAIYVDDYANEQFQTHSNDIVAPHFYIRKILQSNVEADKSNETTLTEKEEPKETGDQTTFEKEEPKENLEQTILEKDEAKENGEMMTFVKEESKENGEQMIFEEEESMKNGEQTTIKKEEPTKQGEQTALEKEEPEKNGEQVFFEKEEPKESNKQTISQQEESKEDESSHITTKHRSHPSRIKSHEHHVPKKEMKSDPSTLKNYPFAVSVQRKGVHYASGALIDTKWVLSSGAEFYNVRESIKLFRIRFGSIDCKKGGTVIPIKRIEIHPSYVFGQPNFDLSLLRLAQPVKFSDVIRPVVLSKIRTKVISAKFMITYWSRIIVKGEPLPSNAKERLNQNIMRVLTQNLVPHNECLFHMKTRNITLHDSTLCLVPGNKHHSTCLPDSGAPVLADDGLWGITSGWTSKDCLESPSPTTFTRLSSLVIRAWLDNEILDFRDSP